MPKFRTLALLSLMIFGAGCGGNPPEVDTAETIRTESVKPGGAPPTATPEAAPAKEVPKG